MIIFTQGKIKTLNLVRRTWDIMVQNLPGEDLLQRNYRSLVSWQKETQYTVACCFFSAIA